MVVKWNQFHRQNALNQSKAMKFSNRIQNYSLMCATLRMILSWIFEELFLYLNIKWVMAKVMNNGKFCAWSHAKDNLIFVILKYRWIFPFRFPFQQYFWRVKQSGHLIDQGMPKITGMFNGLPANFRSVDAVYEGNSGTKYSGITIFIGK